MNETIKQYAIACYSWKILKAEARSMITVFANNGYYDTNFISGKVIDKCIPTDLWKLKNEDGQLVEETIFI